MRPYKSPEKSCLTGFGRNGVGGSIFADQPPPQETRAEARDVKDATTSGLSVPARTSTRSAYAPGSCGGREGGATMARKFDDDELDRLKRNISIEAVCREHGIQLKPHGSQTSSASVPSTKTKSVLHSLAGKEPLPLPRCRRGGSVVDLVMKLDGIDFKEAVRKLLTSTPPGQPASSSCPAKLAERTGPRRRGQRASRQSSRSTRRTSRRRRGRGRSRRPGRATRTLHAAPASVTATDG